MLTRFKVSGFKNLLDLDARFGSFTCILGPMASENPTSLMPYISSACSRTVH